MKHRKNKPGNSSGKRRSFFSGTGKQKDYRIDYFIVKDGRVQTVKNPPKIQGSF
jgi:hypothetical protein